MTTETVAEDRKKSPAPEVLTREQIIKRFPVSSVMQNGAGENMYLRRGPHGLLRLVTRHPDS